MIHFVIVYDRKLEKILERVDLPEAEQVRAWDERDRLVKKYLREPNVEVVLFGSKSEEDLRATHGRYFVPLGPTTL